jgi:hypothetical protein
MKKLSLFLFALAATFARADVLIPWRTITAIPSPTLTLSGDASGSTTFLANGGATLSTTLTNVNSNVGTFGNATQSLTLIADAKGRITAVSAQTVTPAWTSITGKPTTAAGFGITNGAALDTFGAFTTTGLVAQTSAGNYAARTLTAPAAGISVTNGSGVAGNPTLVLANDLAGVEGLSTNGIAARTATDTWTTRTITAPAAGITVGNGDGVAGNPTLALANDLAAVEGLSGTGIPARTATDTWTTRTLTAGTGISVSNGDGVAGNPTINNTGVTSVAMTVPGTFYSVSGSPVTTTGTLALSLLTQSANTFFAGPVSGSAATPTMRTLVQADTQLAEAPNRNALATRGGVRLNGFGTSFAKAGMGTDLITTGPFSISMMLRIPQTALASSTLAAISSGTTDNVPFSFNVILRPSGFVEVQLIAATNSANIRYMLGTDNLLSLYGGETVHLVVIRNGAAQPTVKINGTTLAFGADVTSGTPPADWSGTVTGSNFLFGHLASAVGEPYSVFAASLYNFALTSAEILEVFKLGGGVPARFQYGTEAAIYSSDFSAGVDGWWTGDGTTITGNIDQDADGVGSPPSNDG